MSYRVTLNDRAEGQLEAAYLWWFEHRSALLERCVEPEPVMRGKTVQDPPAPTVAAVAECCLHKGAVVQ